MKFAKTLLSAACFTLLAGCSTMTDIRDDAREAQGIASHQADALLAARPSRNPSPAVGPVVSDLPYVDTRAVSRAPRYPASFSQQITVNEPGGIPIQVLAQRVQSMTGVQMLYQSEIVSSGVAPLSVASLPPVALDSSDAVLSNLPPLAGGISATTVSTLGAVRSAGIPVSYSGEVVGLFNTIAAATHSSWEYNDVSRTVQFYRYKTATFRIPAVQGISSSRAEMGQANSGSGESAISMATASGSHETKSSPWDEVEAAIKQLVSVEGVYAVSPTTGSITVRDRPDRIESIRGYLQDAADAMSRQVDVEVTVYRVVMRDDDTRAVNWNGLFRSVLGQYSLGFDSMAGRPDIVSGGLSSAILNIPLTDASGAFQRWGGSQVVVDALSTLGKTSVVTTTSVLTGNNQPAPVKIVKRTSYLASVSQNMSSVGNTVGSTGPTLTPGMVETGLNLYVLPHIQDDGKRMLLKMMVSLSTLEAMDKFGNDQAMIQLPQVASREFEQQAWLNSGETLVLAGFEQVDSGMDTQSPFDKRLWLFGGSSRASKGREMVVITIHPTVTAVRSRI